MGLFLRHFFSDSISSLSLILFTISISHLMPVYGYGVNGSQSYINPLDQPQLFISRIPQYVLSAIGVLFFSIPARIVNVIPNGFVIFAIIGLFTAGILFKNYHFPSDAKAPLLWIGLASILAYVPSIAGNVTARSMLYPSIGISISIAILIRYGLSTPRCSRGGFFMITSISGSISNTPAGPKYPFKWLHFLAAPVYYLLRNYRGSC